MFKDMKKFKDMKVGCGIYATQAKERDRGLGVQGWADSTQLNGKNRCLATRGLPDTPMGPSDKIFLCSYFSGPYFE